jgi:DNA-binding GntR family transcriptional regulator
VSESFCGSFPIQFPYFNPQTAQNDIFLVAMKRQKTNTRVSGASVRDRAYRHIRKLIADGTLEAGAPVSELLLAKELGSSRTPIREAMKQLDAEGLLEQNQTGGMIVAQLKREDIIELYELREALEVYSVCRVSKLPLRPADRDRLQATVDQLLVLKRELEDSGAAEMSEEQNSRFTESDLGFHALLMSMTGNSRIQKILHDTRLLIRVFAIRRSGPDAAQLQGIYEFHQQVLDAVAEQNPEKAMAAMAGHIQASQRERLNEYDSWRREASLRHHLPEIFDLYARRPRL